MIELYNALSGVDPNALNAVLTVVDGPDFGDKCLLSGGRLLWERDAGGFFARHLYVLFEDVANLLAENGIRMTLDGFTWDNNMIRPFRKNQLYASGQQGVV